MPEWVEDVERAYVAAATGGGVPRGIPPRHRERARAAVGAIASRYLAVGTPRTFGIVVESATLDEGPLSLVAHRTWFAPTEIRCAAVAGRNSGNIQTDLGTDFEHYLAKQTGGRIATLAEALASDVVCVHAGIQIRATQLRRGTHVNVLSSATIDDELRKLATVADEATLGQLAAGLIDGRQLDELTVFLAGDLGVALGALG